jgi:hypothetical protein
LLSSLVFIALSLAGSEANINILMVPAL